MTDAFFKLQVKNNPLAFILKPEVIYDFSSLKFSAPKSLHHGFICWQKWDKNFRNQQQHLTQWDTTEQPPIFPSVFINQPQT